MCLCCFAHAEPIASVSDFEQIPELGRLYCGFAFYSTRSKSWSFHGGNPEYRVASFLLTGHVSIKGKRTGCTVLMGSSVSAFVGGSEDG
jgi:hypothetical protein